MKALCVRQPWASLIAAGRKTVELRSWGTHKRGTLVIVASGCRAVSDDGRDAADRLDLELDELPRGAALCVAELVDSRPMRREDAAAACCPYDPDAFAWVLGNVCPFECPIPMRGQLSFFTPPAGVAEAAEELVQR